MRRVRPFPRYDGYADWYDAKLAPYIEAAGRDLLALLGSGPGRCLDLACGTGVNLRGLTDAGWSVVGVDLSSSCVANGSCCVGYRAEDALTVAEACRDELGGGKRE